MTKEMLLQAADKMPDSFNMDELFERLVFLERLQKSQASLDSGDGIPHDELKRRMQAYIKNRSDERNNMVA